MTSNSFLPVSVLERYQLWSTPPICDGQLPAPHLWPPTVGPREYDRYPSLSALCFGDPKTFTDEPLDLTYGWAAAGAGRHTDLRRWRALPQSLKCRCLDHPFEPQKPICTAPRSWLSRDEEPVRELEPFLAARYDMLEFIVQSMLDYCEDRCICAGRGDLRPQGFGREAEAWKIQRLARWQRAHEHAAREDMNACGEGPECWGRGGLTTDFKTQCGQPCNGFSDCASARGRPECGDAVACEHKESLPKVFGKIGLCTGIGALMGLRPRKERLGSLSGRDEDDRSCVCNSSFVSKACCFQQDGMVWNPGGHAVRTQGIGDSIRRT